MEQFLRTERADSPNLPYWLLGLDDVGRQTTLGKRPIAMV